MSDLWETLVATALVGTDRKTPNFSNMEGALGQILSQLEGHDINHQLLSAAGAIALSHQAGVQSTELSAQLPTPCPEDEQPLCSSGVHGLLETVVAGTHRAVLPELLSLIQSHGMRVSEQSIPILLQLGRQRSELRDRVRAVIGLRGQWLAQQNPDWHYMSRALSGIDERNVNQQLATAQWETETTATRLALLRQLRAVAPKFARELLASSWKQDKAKERAEFLNCLQIQLSEADEDFLEAALNDRSKEVKAIASVLLASLPTSKLCQRMSERAQTLISTQETPSGLDLTVTLPRSDDTADGLTATKSKDMGQRSSLLMQIIAAVPLSHWEHPPSALIQAASPQDSRLALLKGWRLATQRQQNPEWAKALITHHQKDTSKNAAHPTELFVLLSPSERETHLSQWLTRLCEQKKWDQWRQSIPRVIEAHPFPSLAFSQALIQWFLQDFKADMALKKKTYPYHLRSLIQDLGYYLHPDCYPEAVKMLQMLDVRDDQRERLLADWVEILSFRHSMTQLFIPS